MATVTLPYRLQVWLPQELRKQLKDLAHAQGITLQDLVVNVLEDALHDPPKARDTQDRSALATATP
jgi:hypothetical protein